MKKVIFIGGTSYSGSTILDMILANDPHGFSCGEVKSLFYPSRPHHVNPECGCGDETCAFWGMVKKRGVKNLYHSIFELQPKVDFVVDSSKDPFWIKMQSENLQKSNIKVVNVIIWKTPLELAFSFKKRGRLDDWEKSLVGYYRLYFSLIDNFVKIKYNRLTRQPGALRELCDLIEIPYHSGKEQYWNKIQHTLFGNTSAKIHLYRKSTTQYQQSREKLEKQGSKDNEDTMSLKYKKIYYNEVCNPQLDKYVQEKYKNNKYFPQIFEILNNGWNPNFIERTQYPWYLLLCKNLQSKLFMLMNFT